MATKRVNIRVSEQLHQWFMERSQATGVAVSSLMALALEEHMVQREAVVGVSAINKIIEKNDTEGK